MVILRGMTLKQAIKHFENKAALARALGISPQAVTPWKTIPKGRQYQLEVMTKGVLRADK